MISSLRNNRAPGLEGNGVTHAKWEESQTGGREQGGCWLLQCEEGWQEEAGEKKWRREVGVYLGGNGFGVGCGRVGKGEGRPNAGIEEDGVDGWEGFGDFRHFRREAFELDYVELGSVSWLVEDDRFIASKHIPDESRGLGAPSTVQ